MSRFVGRLLNCSVFIVFSKSTERLALVGAALVLFLFPFHSNAQIDNNFFNGGGIRVGDSTTACAGNGGGIRFDADSSDGGGLQYCDGTSWLDILTGTITGDVSQGGNSFAAPMIIGTNDNNTLAFETNGSTRMTIDTSGNVGVGTTAPGAKLDVEGAILSGPKGAAGGDGGSILFEELAANGTNFTGFRAPDALGSDLMYELPGVAPTAGQVLSSDASGLLSWVNAGGTGDFMADGSVAMTGQFDAADGTQAAPGISFANDRDTGFYRANANEINVSTGNTLAFQFESSNMNRSFTNMIIDKDESTVYASSGASIGPTGGSGLWLDNLQGTTGTFNRITFTSRGGGNVQRSYFASISNGSGYTPDFAFLQQTGSSSYVERLRIDSAGNVGVGTTVPATSLDINGAESMRGIAAPALSPSGQGRIYFDSTSNTYQVSENGGAYTDLVGGGGGSGDFLADGTIPMTGSIEAVAGSASVPAIFFDSDTNTGIFQPYGDAIGFTVAGNGNFAMDVNGFYSAGTGSIMIAPGSGGTVNPNYTFNGDNNTGMFRPAADNIGFSTDGSERIRIDATGNVGIGTTSPTRRLEVMDNSGTNIYPLIIKGGATNFVSKRVGIEIRGLSSSSNSISRIISGHQSATPGTDDSFLAFETREVSGSVTEKVRISAEGNVGIGTTTPNVALDVNGSIEYTGTITDVSDRRLKENIKPIEGALETIVAVDGVSFIMRGDEKRRIEFGVIAQDVEEVLPELVHTADDEMKSKSVNYVGFIGWIIEAIKDLASNDDNLQLQIDEIRVKDKKISDLENEVRELKSHKDKKITVLENEIKELRALIEEKLK